MSRTVYADTTEGRFTAPTVDCPYPERWTSPDAYATEHQVTALVAAMVVALQPDFVLETGTYLGDTANAIGEALLANGSGVLVSLEVDELRAEAAAKRCSGLPVSVRCGDSLTWTPTVPIDFAFFDSAADIRHLEFLRFLPWMNRSTVVGFHDTGPQHVFRERYLAPLEAAGYISPLYLPTPRGVCFSRVNGGDRW